MKRFPSQFAGLLNPAGREVIRGGRQLPQFRELGSTPIAYFPDVVRPDLAREATRTLDANLLSYVRELAVPVPRNWRRTQRSSFAERLTKTVRNSTVSLNTPGTRAYRAATECGLLAMMRSTSFRRFAEVVTGDRLGVNGRQLICYKHGDFVGPHNDYHPELPHLRNGYVDLHVSFCNADVQSQTLVYEREGFLSEAISMAGLAGITVYRLPFWHYASPLVGRPGREVAARRWLILGSFEILS